MGTIPDVVREVLLRLDAQAPTYLVGGSVRDALLERQTNDFDICTTATLALMVDLFHTETGFHAESAYEAVHFLRGPYQIQITRMRKESGSDDQRHPQTIEWTNQLQEDVRRRDLTINALYWHPTQGILDPCGQGLLDLQNHIIRFIGDPKLRISEDALRLLRTVRFAAQLDFVIEDQTSRALQAQAGDISRVSQTHQTEELRKLLKATDIKTVMLAYPDLFALWLPWLAVMVNYQQDNPYHCYDLYEHTVRVADACSPDVCVRLAALLHDSGKPDLRITDAQGIGHYQGHDARSYDLAKQWTHKLELTRQETRQVCHYVRNHGLSMPEDSDGVFLRLVLLGDEEALVYWQLKVADHQMKTKRAAHSLAVAKQGELKTRRMIRTHVVRKPEQLALSAPGMIALGVAPNRLKDVQIACLLGIYQGQCMNSQASLTHFILKH